MMPSSQVFQSKSSFRPGQTSPQSEFARAEGLQAFSTPPASLNHPVTTELAQPRQNEQEKTWLGLPKQGKACSHQNFKGRDAGGEGGAEWPERTGWKSEQHLGLKQEYLECSHCILQTRANFELTLIN